MLRIKPSFVLYLLLLSYLNPNDIFYPFLFAAALHECAHLLVLRLLGKRLISLTLCFAEAELKTELLSPPEELLAAAAGPAANFLCAAVCKTAFSHFAAVSFLLGLLNLLPVMPLDGGRIIRALLQITAPRRAEQILRVISWTVQLSLLLLTAYFSVFRGLGLLPLVFAASLSVKQKNKLLFFRLGDKIKKTVQRDAAL